MNTHCASHAIGRHGGPCLEQLESRIAPSGGISVDGPTSLPVGNVQPGQVVKFNVLNFSTSDPNDPSEGENLIIYSDQNPGVAIATFEPGQSGQVSYTVQLKNQTFSAAVENYDGDEGATISVSAPGIDLAVNVNSAMIVPTNATDLHLLSVFGKEHVNVPIEISNLGQAVARGPVSISLYLSDTPDLSDGFMVPLGTKMQTIDLAGGASVPFTIAGQLPAKSLLQAGNEYYVVAKITAPTIHESDSNGITDTNNIAGSSDQYEFLGTPRYITDAASGNYFKFVRDTLNGVEPAKVANVNVADPVAFISAFEGSGLAPYVDSEGHPTIGIGLNLDNIGNLPTSITTELVNDVMSYYAANHPKVHLPGTASGIISMLKAQAHADPRGTNPNDLALTSAQQNQLFQDTLQVYITATQNVLGLGVYNGLSARERVAAIDIQYNNTGGLAAFPAMVNALENGDFVRAGFELVDSARTTQAPGLTIRTEAEYENLLAGHLPVLGNLV